VEIEGEVSRLVDHAMLNRKIMHKRGAVDVHSLPVAAFWFYVDLDRRLSPDQEGLWCDAAIIGRMLDDADRPVTFREMIASLNDRARDTTPDELATDEDRARIALAQFKRDKWVRSVRLAQHDRDWVWNDRAISDDVWRERFEQDRVAVATAVAGVQTSGPIGRVGLSPPGAHVVVIGPRPSLAPDRS
jgi:hypothetical protein